MKITPSIVFKYACLAVAASSLCLLSLLASAQRLPQTVRPAHYFLTLTPHLQAATFSGIESIDVVTFEPTNAITLNAVQIAFQSVTVTAAGKLQAATVSLDNDKEQATFTFPSQIPAGKATLHIAFTGILNNQLRGFYLSKTTRRNYAVTQFESTDARRAFPSFDEPAFKATFNISLVVDKGDMAISNSPIDADTPGPGAAQHTLKFFPTPKMSTYLVAFLIGDFQCSAGQQDGVAIRVCATPDKVDLTRYGVGVAEHMLHYYNQYFGIPYPLKKLDLIALPDFEAGAMENFGAITYRETDLLIDPRNASVGAKQEVALVIAHEMAHQWFGDLVTMQWWNNIWLNEGFATWMESKAVASMHPEWNMDQSDAAGLNATLNLDAQPTTRAIRANADTRAEIEQMFDGISYGKAGAVLLSVENYLGPETFRQGVQKYLKAHEYGNATAEDFWNAQTAVSHKPVDAIMESLVTQPGVPILTFGEPSGGRVSVTQQRFYLSPEIKPSASEQWTLPVCFAAATGEKDCQVLTPATSSFKLPSISIFFANAGGKGYYRSVYPADVYAKLVAGVETRLTAVERISLIGDEWAQTQANKATIGDYLNLVAAVSADPNADVVETALDGVTSTYNRIAASPQEKAGLSAWIRRTFSPQLARLGAASPSDSASTRELRAGLFSILGVYGNDPAVLSQAREVARKYLANPASVDATMGLAALSIAARRGDAALFGSLQHIAETSTNPELQVGTLRMLAQFQNPALLQRALDYSVSGKVRSQDAAFMLAIAMSESENRSQAWNFIQSNWDKVRTQLTPEMGSILVRSTSNFCTATARDQVQSFFAAHRVPAANRALRHAIEHINGCTELRGLQAPNLEKWLAAQPKS